MVIKKQLLGEADEIVTLFSREHGKVRAVAKSTKLATSKLQYALQPLFLVEVALAGRTALPKLIRASATRAYSNAHGDPSRVSIWFVVAELLIKLLPDNQPNEALYDSTASLLEFLDTAEELSESRLQAALLKFKIAAMGAAGMAIHDVAAYDQAQTMFFSPSRGGFYYGSAGGADSVPVQEEIWHQFRALQDAGFSSLPETPPGAAGLSKLVAQFIVYQLEREIKSEKYL